MLPEENQSPTSCYQEYQVKKLTPSKGYETLLFTYDKVQVKASIS